MSYFSIENLYKNQDILIFKRCYALEKIHGTSAHISWSAENQTVGFFSGGENYERFCKLFDKELLKQKFVEMGCASCFVYGEAAGGKQQGMSATYGKELFFIVFEVKMSDKWLDVPISEFVAKTLGLEFVPYREISTDLIEIDAERDRDSEVAIRKGMGEGKKREGVVLRPLMELTKNNGGRILAKHKNDEFSERKNTPKVIDPERLKVLTEANAIAEEWTTEMRLTHILDLIPKPYDVSQMPIIMKAMVEDIEKEAKGEIVTSKECHKAINKKTAELFTERIKNSLYKNI